MYKHAFSLLETERLMTESTSPPSRLAVRRALPPPIRAMADQHLGGQRREDASGRVAALLAGALLSLGCSVQEAAAESAEPTEALVLPTVTPQIRDEYREHAFVCELRAAQRAEIRTRTSGVLKEIAVDDGQQVTEGQLLFTLETQAKAQAVVVAKAAAAAARTELQAARIERDNTKRLQERGVVSAAELALAESKVKTLKARADEASASTKQASVEFELTTIRAPFAGVVNRVPRMLGSSIGEDEFLTTVTDTSTVFAYFRLTEREYLQFRSATLEDVSTAVTLELPDGSRYPLSGVIDAAEAEVDSASGTIALRARFENPDGALRHGGGGKIVVRKQIPDALLVPQKSTFDTQGNIYVYVIDATGKATARRIHVADRVGEWFVVDSGLAPTDRFVLEGIQKIREGDRIVPATGDDTRTAPGV